MKRANDVKSLGHVGPEHANPLGPRATPSAHDSRRSDPSEPYIYEALLEFYHEEHEDHEEIWPLAKQDHRCFFFMQFLHVLHDLHGLESDCGRRPYFVKVYVGSSIKP